MVHRGAGKRVADAGQHGLARIAVLAAGPHLDQLVRGEGAVDFLQDGVGQARVADKDDRLQGVGGGTKIATLA